MVAVAASVSSDLHALRLRAAWLLAALLWLHVPLVALIALSNHAPVLDIALGMTAAAALGTAAAGLWGGDVRARCTIAVALTVAPALMVYAGTGAWEVDWHMYFFVVLGMLVAFVDWRPIAVCATLTVLHHFVLTLVFPSAVFPHADLARVALHGFIVLGEALVLFWIVRQMSALFTQSAASLEVAQAALERSDLLQSAVVNANDAIVICEMARTRDLDAAMASRRVVYTNEAFTRITQYDGADVVGKTLAILYGKKTVWADLERCLESVLRGESGRFVGILYARDGREIDIEMSLVGVPDSSTRMLQTIAVLRDVTESRLARETLLRAELAEVSNVALQREIDERRSVEQRLAFAAGHDALTGLPNRAHFRERLTAAIAAGKSTSSEPAVLLVDIDRFKAVNDGLGHVAGDSLLSAIAQRLGSCLREEDALARLGTDEFIVLIEKPAGDDEVERIAHRLLASFAAPFHLLEREVYLTASIGIARGDEFASAAADDLMRNADLAMAHAKSLGKARYELYEP